MYAKELLAPICNRSVGPERLLVDLERLLIKRFGLGVIAHLEVEKRQVIETLGNVRVVGPERLLTEEVKKLPDRK